MLIVRSLVLVRLSAAVLSALWITAAQLGEQRRESGMGEDSGQTKKSRPLVQTGKLDPYFTSEPQ